MKYLFPDSKDMFSSIAINPNQRQHPTICLGTYAVADFYKEEIKKTNVSTVFNIKLNNKINIPVLSTKGAGNTQIDPDMITVNDIEAFGNLVLIKIFDAMVSAGKVRPMNPKARVLISDMGMDDLAEDFYQIDDKKLMCGKFSVGASKKPTQFLGTDYYDPDIIASIIMLGLQQENITKTGTSILLKKLGSIIKAGRVDLDNVSTILAYMNFNDGIDMDDVADIIRKAQGFRQNTSLKMKKKAPATKAYKLPKTGKMSVVFNAPDDGDSDEDTTDIEAIRAKTAELADDTAA